MQRSTAVAVIEPGVDHGSVRDAPATIRALMELLAPG
jgi:hypothetical protein